MVAIEKTWMVLKALLVERYLKLQYEEFDEAYELYCIEDTITYVCNLERDGGTDVVDFETNYKADANKPIQERYPDGRPIIRSESRPQGCTTMFTMTGDNAVIGDGTEIKWDFSDTDNDVTPPTGFKKKRIKFSFLDSVWIKEGCIYFHNCLKGSYINLYVVCPTGGYYKKNDGTVAQATEDTIIHNYVNKHFVQGTCQMGDELNTETSSDELYSYLEFWLDITVPDSDATSNGYVEIELYRARTRILE